MKNDANSLPDDPEQLKKMLLELQQVVAQKDEELAEENDVIAQKDKKHHALLEAYNAKLAKEYGKKSEKMPVTPIPRSIATSSLLSQIITCKYQFGLPLYRQETFFADIGIELSRQTMSSWMLRCGELLMPLYLRLKERLLSKPAIHADETPLTVIKAEKSTSYMWVYCCGDDKPGKKANIVLFDYHNSRAGQCAVDFLNGYPGYMHVDGYKAYEQKEASLVACLAHIRRKFVDVKKIQNKSRVGKVDVALSFIGKLYGIEQAIKGKKADEKYDIRQEKAKPIVIDFHQWLLAHKEKVPPKIPLGKAITYALNQF